MIWLRTSAAVLTATLVWLAVPAVASPSTVAVKAAIAAKTAAAKAATWATIDAPAAPDSALGRRLAHHAHEAAGAAESRRFVEPAAPAVDASFGYSAANYEGLPKTSWRIEHQDVTATLTAATGALALQIGLTVRAAEPDVTVLTLAIAKGDTIAAKLGDVALEVKLTPLSDTYVQCDVTLPAPLTVDVDTVIHFERTRKLNCQPGFQGFRPCALTGTFQWVIGSEYFLRPAWSSSPFRWDLHVITSSGAVVGAPGQPSPAEALLDGKTRWNFKQVERTHHGGFGIAAYAISEKKATVGMPAVRVYSVHPYSTIAKVQHDLIADVVGFYQERFTGFPWTNLNFIQLGNDFGGGMAPLGGVFLYANVMGAEPDEGAWDGANELIAHELGHQWWGNLVDPHGSADVSLSESLAEYSSCLFTETRLGTRRQMQSDNLSYSYTVAAKDDRPLASVSVYGSTAYVKIVYHKGAVVMDMLRRELGDDLMHKGLAAFATKYNRDVARVQDLHSVMESVAGRSLKWFFQQWFYKLGQIRAQFAVRTGPVPGPDGSNGDGTWRVQVRVDQPEGEPLRFKLPVIIEMQGGKTETFSADIIPVGKAPVVVEFTVPTQPLRVKPDLSRTLLRRFGSATPGDSNLSGLVDGSDLVDMALRTGRTLVMKGKNGQTWFYTDLAWNELYDLVPDFRVDGLDRAELDDWIGTETEAF